MLGAFIVMAGAVVATILASRGRDRDVIPFALAALAFHVVSAFAQVWLAESYYAGSADIFLFADYGRAIERLLVLDFGRFFPEVMKLALHLDSDLQFARFEGGDSTTTMYALTGLLFFAFGTNLTIPYIVAAVCGWAGQLFLAKMVLRHVRDDERSGALFAMMLVPSVVFWSSGVVKEAFMLGGLGLMCWSLERTFIQRKLFAVVGVGVGGLVVGLLKPYVLFPFAVAIGIWFLVSRADGRVRIRWGAAVAAAVFAVGGIVALSALFPTFSIDRLAEETAQRQEAWDAVGGGSEVALGGGGKTSIASQIPYIPVALINSLFRPIIFEARNLTQFVAAVETTVLIGLVLRLVTRVRGGRLRDLLLRDPLLSSAFVFVVLFSIAVGLTTRNLGSLSRYRMPMVPFYVLLVLVASRRSSHPQGVGAESPES